MDKDKTKETVDPNKKKEEPKKEEDKDKAPIPEDLKKKLDETVKIQLQLDDNGQVKMTDEVNALNRLAVKGLLSDIKDSDARTKISKLVEGRSLVDSIKIIETFVDLAPKASVMPGVPLPGTDGVPQPFSAVKYSMNARVKK